MRLVMVDTGFRQHGKEVTMDVVRWTPFRELDTMERRMRRLFDETGFTSALLPAADAYETEDEYVVELEAPGFEEKELTLEIFDHTLAIKGGRAEETEKEDKTFHLRERLESRFERRFVLPAEADTNALKADFEQGVLVVHAPKSAAVKPRQVPIGK
jgi:HSP20 family protein